MTCELARFSSDVESCDAAPTHQVTTQLEGDVDPRDTFALCRAHAAGALRQRHRHPPVVGEIVSVAPGV